VPIETRSKLWKTADAGQISWWEDAKVPPLGGDVRFSLDNWIGAPMLRKALGGGPALHTGNWSGNLIVRPEKLLHHMVQAYGLKPLRYNHGSSSQVTVLGSSDTMMSIDIENPEAPKAYLQIATVKEASLQSLAKLARGILQPDDPRKGYVFALAAGMGGYQLSRIGAAGTPLERGNYTASVLDQYDHVVSDLKADSPCGRLVIMSGVPGGGKCVAKGTKIMDASTGILLPVEEAVQRRCKLPTFSRENGVIITKPSAWLNTGVKECLKITTKAGHVLEATPEHPLLTPDDFKRLDQIQPGTYVAAAASVPFPEEMTRISDDHVVLLATLLAEGNYTQNHVGFTNADPDIVDAVRTALKCIGGELRQYPSMESFEWRVITPRDNPGFSEIRKFLDKYGMGHKLAPEKVIPEVVFRLGPDQLAKFIGLLWSCDGSIEKGKGGDITLGMSSKELIEQVQHLLLRFGIKTRMRPRTKKLKGKQFFSWDLRVIATSRKTFRDTIPLVGEKVDKLRTIKLGQNPNDDNIPLTESVCEAIQKASNRHLSQGGSLLPIGELLGWEGKVSTAMFVGHSGRETISRRVLEAFISVTKAEELAWLTRGVRWEKVVSVEPVGEREVYDFTVPETHNFLANDLVAHNTFIARALLADVPNAAFVVVPPHLVKDLGSPELIPALVQAKNYGSDGPIVLVLEDADKVLVNRAAGDMAAISSLLNLGDGILGGVIDARILATTNASKLEMDPATRRPGRLCSHVDVGSLDPEHASSILRRLTGKNITANKPVTLAQIYYVARKHGWMPPPKTPERPRNHFRDDILPEMSAPPSPG